MENIEVKELEQIDKKEAQALQDIFNTFFSEIEAIKEKAMAIKITNEDQKDMMKDAREYRLELKKIRTNAEKTRKELKEESLRKGKAIDGIANIIKYIIVPIEEHLEAQEKYIENIQKERKQKIKAERELLLSSYIEDLSLFNIDDMTDEQFTKLLENSKQAHELKLQAEKQAEEERQKKEAEEKIENERIRVENERLKKEAEEKEKQYFQDKKEAEEKERLLQQKLKEAEEKEKQKQVEDERLKKEAEEKEKSKGEREKILDFILKLENITLPELKSEKGVALNQSIHNYIKTLITKIKDNM